ncbi:PCI domain-containing protein 2 [Wickerhamomyces ciferrii]|uniref:PCI domain-containing protein 2 n=1 Tax=Wickerhamomyces ciferrii (strain ATCC 14091 / BCRC 22168 / CBS 111 / JCM 3599 / NBRC 0793 / NRRL Y-1031 F-60-10) TaxID=1206466 RepID=K0KHV1_WICCF|nr:PCI domain-containing protein 2 [Wickerhamomyces ciferrii]CCH42596.1 PCI domain-containing protein 2 [Wickerhamomyces ciferrii]
MESIQFLIDKLNREDGEGLAEGLKDYPNSINVGNLSLDIIEKDSSLTIEIGNILKDYIRLNKALNSPDKTEKFYTSNDLLKNLNRFAEQKTVWIVKSLMVITKNLINYAIEADDYIEKNPTIVLESNHFSGNQQDESCLIIAARTIHNSYKLCLNDRNEDLLQSRRQCIYYFVGQELKIYHKLNNKDMAKNMEKVFKSKEDELPSLSSIPKSHAITYLYYSGALSCGDGNFKNAYFKFKYAYQLCSKKDMKHKENILVYLIPLKFLITKKYPNLTKLKMFPKNYEIYNKIFTSLINGDLKTFEKYFELYENFFLKKNLYLVIENLTNFILLKLFKTIYKSNNLSSHLSIITITRGLEFSKYHTNNSELERSSNMIGILNQDETECIIANLIYQGYIKGYLSHTNGVLVLSKKDPFPKQVKLHDDME